MRAIDRVAFASLRAFDLDAAKHHDQAGRVNLEVALFVCDKLLEGSAFVSLGPK